MAGKPQSTTIDAGLRSLKHYRERLRPWRRKLRESLIPLVRWDTPVIASFQHKYRSPNLDAYFAFTANLGTHTFYMAMLPVLVWCGQTQLFRVMIHMLAAGVFFSGYIKDTVCLPRPLSPPVQRISQSASAPLEYGFPSTHATNAFSVAVYAIHAIRNSNDPFLQSYSIPLQLCFHFYTITIVLGRLYCGMHGFFDITIGSLLGAVIAVIQIQLGPLFDVWISTGPFKNTVIVSLIILALVRRHPEPADDCPCFDDSVAFSGTFIGAQLACYHFSHSPHAISDPMPSTIPFDLSTVGLPLTVFRILLGITIIFGWRAVAKPTLLRVLPPIFRVGGKLGLLLPRKFFLNVNQYSQVPPLRKDDNVIPRARDIPGMLTSLRHPRKRAVSIGPQSEADAYEFMEVRERKRRESQGRESASPPRSPVLQEAKEVAGSADGNAGVQPMVLQPESPTEEEDDEELFRRLLKPRVRYDVEVVTKLIVYTGIAWLAAEGNPLLFVWLGLAPKA